MSYRSEIILQDHASTSVSDKDTPPLGIRHDVSLHKVIQRFEYKDDEVVGVHDMCYVSFCAIGVELVDS